MRIIKKLLLTIAAVVFFFVGLYSCEQDGKASAKIAQKEAALVAACEQDYARAKAGNVSIVEAQMAKKECEKHAQNHSEYIALWKANDHWQVLTLLMWLIAIVVLCCAIFNKDDTL